MTHDIPQTWDRRGLLLALFYNSGSYGKEQLYLKTVIGQ